MWKSLTAGFSIRHITHNNHKTTEKWKENTSFISDKWLLVRIIYYKQCKNRHGHQLINGMTGFTTGHAWVTIKNDHHELSISTSCSLSNHSNTH